MKDDAYYAMKIYGLREKSKNLSLVTKGADDDQGTYQIWSYGSDGEEMHHPIHGSMYANHVEGRSEKKSMVGEEFVDSDWAESEKREEEERRRK